MASYDIFFDPPASPSSSEAIFVSASSSPPAHRRFPDLRPGPVLMREEFVCLWEKRSQIATCRDLASWRLLNEEFSSLPEPLNYDERVTADEVAIALLEGYRHQHGAYLASCEEKKKARRRTKKARQQFIESCLEHLGIGSEPTFPPPGVTGDLSLPASPDPEPTGWEILDSWP